MSEHITSVGIETFLTLNEASLKAVQDRIEAAFSGKGAIGQSGVSGALAGLEGQIGKVRTALDNLGKINPFGGFAAEVTKAAEAVSGALKKSDKALQKTATDAQNAAKATQRIAAEAKKVSTAFHGVEQVVSRLVESLKVVDVSKVVKGTGLSRVKEEAQAVRTAMDATIRQLAQFTNLQGPNLTQIVKPFRELQTLADEVGTKIKTLNKEFAKASAGGKDTSAIKESLRGAQKELTGVIGKMKVLRKEFDETFRARTVSALRSEIGLLQKQLGSLNKITTSNVAQREIAKIEKIIAKERELFANRGRTATQSQVQISALTKDLDRLNAAYRQLREIETRSSGSGFKGLLDGPLSRTQVRSAIRLNQDLATSFKELAKAKATLASPVALQRGPSPEALLGISHANLSAAQSALALFSRSSNKISPDQILGISRALGSAAESARAFGANFSEIPAMLSRTQSAVPSIEALDTAFARLVDRLRQIDTASAIKGQALGGGLPLQLKEISTALDTVISEVAKFRTTLTPAAEQAVREFERVAVEAKKAMEAVSLLRRESAKTGPGRAGVSQELGAAEAELAALEGRLASLHGKVQKAMNVEAVAQLKKEFEAAKRAADALSGKTTLVELTQRAALLRKQIALISANYKKLGLSAEQADIKVRALSVDLHKVGLAAKAAGSLEENFGKLHGVFRSLTKDIRGLIVQQTRFYGGMFLIFGSVRQITDALKDVVEFEDAFRRIGIIAGFDAKNLQLFNAQLGATHNALRELARTSPVESAGSLAQNFLEIVKAGSTLEEAMVVLRGAVRLSVIEGGGLDKAINALITIQKAWGISTDGMRNKIEVLNIALNKSRLDLSDLATIFNFVASTSATMGVSFDDVALAISVLRNAGVRASQTGTGLSNFFIRMTQEGNTFGKSLNNLGLKFSDIKIGMQDPNTGKKRTLLDSFKALIAAGKKVEGGIGKVNIVIKELFKGLGIRGGRGAGTFLSQLSTNLDEVQNLSDLIKQASEGNLNPSKSFFAQSDRAMRSASNQAKILRNNFQDLFKEAFQSDAGLASGLRGLNRFVDGLRTIEKMFGQINKLTNGLLGTGTSLFFGYKLLVVLGRITGITVSLKGGLLGVAKAVKVLSLSLLDLGVAGTVFKGFSVSLAALGSKLGFITSAAVWLQIALVSIVELPFVAAVTLVVAGIVALGAALWNLPDILDYLVGPADSAADGFDTLAVKIDKARLAAEKLERTKGFLSWLGSKLGIGQRAAAEEQSTFTAVNANSASALLGKASFALQNGTVSEQKDIVGLLSQFVDNSRKALENGKTTIDALQELAKGPSPETAQMIAAVRNDQVLRRKEGELAFGEEELRKGKNYPRFGPQRKILEDSNAKLRKEIEDRKSRNARLIGALEKTSTDAQFTIDAVAGMPDLILELTQSINRSVNPTGGPQTAQQEQTNTAAQTAGVSIKNIFGEFGVGFVGVLRDVLTNGELAQDVLDTYAKAVGTNAPRTLKLGKTKIGQLGAEDLAVTDVSAEIVLALGKEKKASLEAEKVRLNPQENKADIARINRDLAIVAAYMRAATDTRGRIAAEGKGDIAYPTEASITNTVQSEVAAANRSYLEEFAGLTLKERQQAESAATLAASAFLVERATSLEKTGASLAERTAALSEYRAKVDTRVGLQVTNIRAQGAAQFTRPDIVQANVQSAQDKGEADKLQARKRLLPEVVRWETQLAAIRKQEARDVGIANAAENNAAVDAKTRNKLRIAVLKDKIKENTLLLALRLQGTDATDQSAESLQRLIIAEQEELTGIQATISAQDLLNRMKAKAERSATVLANAKAGGAATEAQLLTLSKRALQDKLAVEKQNLANLLQSNKADVEAIHLQQIKVNGLEKQAAAVETFATKFQASMTTMGDVARSAAESARDAWREGFFDVMTGKFDKLGDVIKNFAAGIERNLSKVAADAAFSALFTGGKGGFGESATGGALNSLFSFFGKGKSGQGAASSYGSFGGGQSGGGPSLSTLGSFGSFDGGTSPSVSASSVPYSLGDFGQVGGGQSPTFTFNVGSLSELFGKSGPQHTIGSFGSLSGNTAPTVASPGSRYSLGNYGNLNNVQIGGGGAASGTSLFSSFAQWNNSQFNVSAAAFGKKLASTFTSPDTAQALGTGLGKAFSGASIGAGMAGNAIGRAMLRRVPSGAASNIGGAIGSVAGGFFGGPAGAFVGGVGGQAIGGTLSKLTSGGFKGRDYGAAAIGGTIGAIGGVAAFTSGATAALATSAPLLAGMGPVGWAILAAAVLASIAVAMFGSKPKTAELKVAADVMVTKVGDTLMVGAKTAIKDRRGFDDATVKAVQDSFTQVIKSMFKPFISFANALPVDLQDSFTTAVNAIHFDIGGSGSKGDIGRAVKRTTGELVESYGEFYSGEGLDAVTAAIDASMSKTAQAEFGITDLVAGYASTIAAQTHVIDSDKAEQALTDAMSSTDTFFTQLTQLYTQVEQKAASLVGQIKQFGQTGTDLIAGLNTELAGLFANNPATFGKAKELLDANIASYKAAFDAATGPDIISSGDQFKGALRAKFNLQGNAPGITGAESENLFNTYIADITDITDKQVGAATEQQNVANNQLIELGKIKDATEAMAKYMIYGEISNTTDTTGIAPGSGTNPTANTPNPNPTAANTEAPSSQGQDTNQTPDQTNTEPSGPRQKFTLFLDKNSNPIKVESLAEAISRGYATSYGGPISNPAFEGFVGWTKGFYGLNRERLTTYREYQHTLDSLPALFRGLAFVPRDNYPALLHRGESVLTKSEADARRSGDTSVEVNIGAPTISIQGAGEAGNELLRKALRQGTEEMTSELTRTLTSLGFTRN